MPGGKLAALLAAALPSADAPIQASPVAPLPAQGSGPLPLLWVDIQDAGQPAYEAPDPAESAQSFAELDRWIRHTSHGRHPGFAATFITLRLTKSLDALDATTSIDAALFTLLRGMGIEPNAYDRQILNWRGSYGSDFAAGWVTPTYPRTVHLRVPGHEIMLHEMMHSLGEAGHANAGRFQGGRRRITLQPYFDDRLEYGSPFDILGAFSQPTGRYVDPAIEAVDGASAGVLSGSIQATHRMRLGWLDRSRMRSLEDGEGLLRVSIHPLDGEGPGPEGRILVARAPIANGMHHASYRIERRQGWAGNPWAAAGVLVRLTSDVSQRVGSGGDILIDTRPETWTEERAGAQVFPSRSGVLDAPLTIGRTYSDPEAGLHIAAIARDPDDPDAIEVEIRREPIPSRNLPPVVVAPIDGPDRLAVGETGMYRVEAYDPDGDALSFGWETTDRRDLWGPGLPDMPGNAPSLVVSWPAPGRYPVRVAVSDRRGGLVWSHRLVTVGSATTPVWSGRVTDDSGAPVANALVTTLESADKTMPFWAGGTPVRTCYTDADGRWFVTAPPPSATLAVMAPELAAWRRTFPVPVDGAFDRSDLHFTGTGSVTVAVTGPAGPVVAAAGATVAFTISRGGRVDQPLTVRLSLGTSRDRLYGQYQTLAELGTDIQPRWNADPLGARSSGSVVIPANATSAVLVADVLRALDQVGARQVDLYLQSYDSATIPSRPEPGRGWAGVLLRPAAQAPRNDRFATPMALVGMGPVVVDQSTALATIETGEPNHATGVSTAVIARSLWYRWEAPSDGIASVAMSGVDLDGWQPCLSIYQGDDWVDLDGRVLASVLPSGGYVLGESVSTNNAQPRIELPVRAGTVYRFVVCEDAGGLGLSPGGGTFRLTLSATAASPDQPPTVTGPERMDLVAGGSPVESVITVADPDGPVSTVVLRAMVGDPAVLPATAASIEGIGTTRFLRIDPAAARPGRTWIHLMQEGVSAVPAWSIPVLVTPGPGDTGTARIRLAGPLVLDEGGSVGELVATSDRPISATVTYQLQGDATEGIDALVLPRFSLRFDGATSATLAIRPIADDRAEPDEVLQVVLVGTTAGFIDPQASSAAVVIRDRTDPAVTVTVQPVADGIEGLEPAVVRLASTGPEGLRPVTVEVAGPSGTQVRQVVVGSDGTTVEISEPWDGIDQGTRRLVVTVLPGDGYQVGAPATAAVRMADPGLPPPLILSASSDTLDQPDGTLRLQAAVATAQPHAITLAWSATGSALVDQDWRWVEDPRATIPPGATRAEVAVAALANSGWSGVRDIRFTLATVEGATAAGASVAVQVRAGGPVAAPPVWRQPGDGVVQQVRDGDVLAITAAVERGSPRALTWSVVEPPLRGTVLGLPEGDATTGIVSYAAPLGASGTDAFTVAVGDGVLPPATRRITVQVGGTMLPPECTTRPTILGDLSVGASVAASPGAWAVSGGGDPLLTWTWEFAASATAPTPSTVAGAQGSLDILPAWIDGFLRVRVQAAHPVDGGLVTVARSAWYGPVLPARGRGDPPAIAVVTTITIDEDTRPAPYAIQTSDDRTAGQDLRIAVTAEPPDLFPAGSVVVEWDPVAAGWRLALQPAGEASGTGSILLTAMDGDGQTATAAVAVTVVAVDDPPRFAAIPDQRTAIGFPLEGVSIVVLDPDDIPETPSATSSDPAILPPSAIRLVPVSGGWSLSATPAAAGTVRIGLRSRSGAGVAWTEFALQLDADQPPVLTMADAVTVDEDGEALIEATVADPDDADGWRWTIAAPAAFGAIDGLPAPGASRAVLRYRPDPDAFGDDAVTVGIQGPRGATAARQVRITVVGIDDPPQCTALPAVTGDPVVGSILTSAVGTWDDERDRQPAPPATEFAITWERATTASGPWTTITGSAGATLAVGDGDAGWWFRSRVVHVPSGASAASLAAGPVPPPAPPTQADLEGTWIDAAGPRLVLDQDGTLVHGQVPASRERLAGTILVDGLGGLDGGLIATDPLGATRAIAIAGGSATRIAGAMSLRLPDGARLGWSAGRAEPPRILAPATAPALAGREDAILALAVAVDRGPVRWEAVGTPEGFLTADPVDADGTTATLTLQPAADRSGGAQVLITALRSDGWADWRRVPVEIAPVNDAPRCVAVPAITGVARVGSGLTVLPGDWSDAVDGAPAPELRSRVWERTRDGVEILAGTPVDGLLSLGVADAGWRFRVLETVADALDPGLTATAASAWSAAVVDPAAWPLVLRVATAAVLAEDGLMALPVTIEDPLGDPLPSLMATWTESGPFPATAPSIAQSGAVAQVTLVPRPDAWGSATLAISAGTGPRRVEVRVVLTVEPSPDPLPPLPGLEWTWVIGDPATMSLPAVTDPDQRSLRWRIDGLPSGLTLDPETGVVAGRVSTPGVWWLVATISSDDARSSSAILKIIVEGIGEPPSVNAGIDQTITLPATAALDATVTDDGLPSMGLTYTWSQVGGPAPVAFTRPDAEDTTVSFTQAGTYVLRLAASDGYLSTSDEVTVIVRPPEEVNQAPMVAAGVDQTITLPAGAALHATVTDDGRPVPAAVTVLWTRDSGPGPVIFTAPGSVDTIASFSVPGTYVLRLAASDGSLSAHDAVTVIVAPAPQPDGRRILLQLVAGFAWDAVALPQSATTGGRTEVGPYPSASSARLILIPVGGT